MSVKVPPGLGPICAQPAEKGWPVVWRHPGRRGAEVPRSQGRPGSLQRLLQGESPPSNPSPPYPYPSHGRAHCDVLQLSTERWGDLIPCISHVAWFDWHKGFVQAYISIKSRYQSAGIAHCWYDEGGSALRNYLKGIELELDWEAQWVIFFMVSPIPMSTQCYRSEHL